MTHRWTKWIAAAVLSAALPACATAQQWEGWNVGAYGGSVIGGRAVIGAWVGYDYSLGNDLYAGVEGDVMYVPSTTAWLGTVSARLGYAVTPDVLAYGRAGYMAVLGGTSDFWLLGAGADIAVADQLALRVEADRVTRIGTGTSDWIVKAGVAYRF